MTSARDHVLSTQQRLWPDPQPLVERLGRDFFRQLPRTPGVYLMRGPADIVLYVGKARNLQHRLGSYRVANPERMARRTLRLVNLVEAIAWEECEDEDAALRREAELLLALQPRFNRAGVWRGPPRYLAWRARPGGLELAVTDQPEENWHCTGPFGAEATYVHQALVRLLWCRLQSSAGLAGMPAGWFHGRHGRRVLVPHPDLSLTLAASERLSRLASGAFEPFQDWLQPATAPFGQTMREDDLEMVVKHLSQRARAKP